MRAATSEPKASVAEGRVFARASAKRPSPAGRGVRDHAAGEPWDRTLGQSEVSTDCTDCTDCTDRTDRTDRTAPVSLTCMHATVGTPLPMDNQTVYMAGNVSYRKNV